MKKSLSFLLCTMIMFTSLFGSITAYGAYHEEIMQPADVVNWDFEAPIIHDASADKNDPDGDKKVDTVLGWVDNGTSQDFVTPGVNKFSVEPDPTNPNNQCLLILDTRHAASGLSTTNVWTDLIPVGSGTTVKVNLSAYLQYLNIGVNESGVNVNSRALYLKIWYFNASGVSIGSAPQYAHENITTNIDKWVEIAMPSVVTPSGTAYIRLMAMCTNAHATKTYIDNIRVNSLKTKAISDPKFTPGSLSPFGVVDMSINITNTAKTNFPVYTLFALFDKNNVMAQLQTLDNSANLTGSSAISSSMELPEDVTGNKMRVLVFGIKDGRIVPYYKWVTVE